ncbi:MAG: AsmA-like C-terminal region-containing protein [Myxococcota bacterium]
MSWVRRALLAFGAAFLLVLLALVVVLPRVAASDAVRGRLSDAVSDAARLPFRYTALEAGLFPVRLELIGAELGHEGAEPAARAERVELRIALLPLLRRTVLVDALVVEGASAHVIRRDRKFELRGAVPEEVKPPNPDRTDEPKPESDGFVFAVRSASVAETRLTLEDDDGSRFSAGPLSADFSLGGSLDTPTGPFTLDLGDAAVNYRPTDSETDALAKAPGVPARLAGQLSLAPDGTASISDLSLALADLAATGTVRVEDRAKVTLDAPLFDLASLLALAPGANDELSGRAALRALSFSTEPPTLEGKLELAPLVFAPKDRHIELAGELVAAGDRLVGKDLEARLGEFAAPLDLHVTDLFGDRRIALDSSVEGADSAALERAFSPGSDRLSGPLDLEIHVSALAEDPLPTLGGTVEFSIAPGRLSGVSLLRSAVESAGLLGSSALEADGGDGDRLGRYYDDEFESLAGSVQIRAGVAHTDDLRLDYRHYGVELRGDVTLDGLALDMAGTLTIDEELDAALRGEPEGRRREIPLAQVHGTVEAPIVRLTPEAIRMIAGAYVTDRRREKWESKIDKYLGEGSGRELLDALLSPPAGEDEPGSESDAPGSE